MINLIINFLTSSSETIFWISAILGTTFFVLRMAMSIFSNGLFEDSADLDDLHGHGEHHSYSLFKFLTMHSLSGFLMLFGWSGLASVAQFNLPAGYAFLVALACGLAMLILTGLIMRGAMLFEGRGSVFSTKQTIGLTGIVYQRIPKNGQGKIHVIVDNNTREILAQSQNKTIESFTIIKIVKALDHEIVEVTELT